jgi:hypothetical protein
MESSSVGAEATPARDTLALVISRRVVPSAIRVERTPRQIAADFERRLEAGLQIRAAGTARRRPARLLSAGYGPRYAVDIFDSRFWLSNVRQNSEIRFFVAWVETPSGGRRVHPRIFYKDVSLVWRVASHWIRSAGENWIGKGDLATAMVDGEEIEYSAEQTTDLPIEVQPALEDLCRRAKRIPTDVAALGLVLRRAPDSRLDPYHDFSEPRRRAREDRGNLVNAGRRIAWFAKADEPESLRFAKGFEPDLARGVLHHSSIRSRLYGGRVDRYRILSTNGRIQYEFMAGPRNVWIVPAQATTTELSTYGVRTIDVVADDDLYVPGYEYHFMDETSDPPELVTQIPPGFAGASNPLDSSRVDASPWLDRLPIIKAFRSMRRRTKGWR